ncbi:MAG: polyprenyl synthetase family protein [Acidobacteriota bacterium]
MKIATSFPAAPSPAPERAAGGASLAAVPPANAEDSPAPATPPETVPGLPVGIDLLARLEGICAHRGLGRLADRLSDMVAFIGQDLEALEGEIARLPRSSRQVNRSAMHLIDLGGKRLRPMCLILTSRMGTGEAQKVMDLAVAVELVHSATLLHDDVVDLSDFRRGAPTARAVYGNAASIFAGDWLLIEALRRVDRCRLEGCLEELFAIIEEMIFAESLQLETRGRVSTDRDLYFQVVEGKTASVFRWAMSAGARVSGLPDADRQALIDYGRHLGITFQATDDLLDLTGDTATTGKDLFADLREGKMTFPLIVALERDPDLRAVIEEILEGEAVSDSAAARVVSSLKATRAVEECLTLARKHSDEALAALDRLPASRARRALATVAETIVDRDL